MSTVLDQVKQTLNDIQQGISNVGFNLLGMAAPLLSIRWTAGADPTLGAATMSLSSSAEWAAPCPGVLTVNGGGDRILMPNGQPLATAASVFRIHPQVHLRLARLYASFIEGRTDGVPVRPVPLYFVYSATSNIGAPESGASTPGDGLKLSGTLTIHDRHGLPIDPIAVACVFDAFLTAFGALEPRSGLSTPPTAPAGRQLNRIAAFGTAGKLLRLADPHGQPFSTMSQLQGLVDAASSSGLYSTTASSISKAAGAPPDLRLGPATNGQLGDTFTLPSAAAGAPTLRRDFFSVVVVDLKPFLIGVRPPDDPASALEAVPDVRHKESLTFTLDGATTLGAANQILSGTPTDAFAVAPIMQGDFVVPSNGQDASAHWPAFPPGLPITNAPIPGTLRTALAPTASFITGTGADVALTLNGLTAGQAVRVYNRVFLPDAREGRGNGAGGVVRSGTSLTLVLRDPLSLVQRGLPPPTPQQLTDKVLHVDVVVINSQGDARVFGNIAVAIDAPNAAPTLTPATNPFGSTTIDRGTAPSGILGLPGKSLPTGQTLSPLQMALALSGEASPREAPRMPTMARRDAVVASVTGTTWQAQLSGAQLIPGIINARHRLGSPGSPGGPEFQTLAVQTSGGQLAYDLNRAALRRTRHLLPRLVLLSNTRWVPPAAATNGNFSAAVLQTVAPVAETPELTAFTSKLDGSNFPADWPATVDKVFAEFPNMPEIPKPLPNVLQNALDSIINQLKNSPSGPRMFDEFKRDFAATVHGRRDAMWALTRALGAARELIYIDAAAFAPTGYGTPPKPLDLVATIRDRLQAVPSLRVILCLSKELDYGPGYEVVAAREYKQRIDAVATLQMAAPSRVVAFHPIGFPGRPLRLMTNVTIVDDVWAMIGSSAFRRRGLTFDGGLDVVLFDTSWRDGRSAAIADLRRRLMAAYLNVSPPPAATPGTFPVAHPSWVRLADAHSAFAVCWDLLDHSGTGLIEPLWNGQVPGTTPITTFPGENVADPDGREFSTLASSLLALIAGLATPPPAP
jgi:hypothetical protein